MLVPANIANIVECELVVQRILCEINTPFALLDNVVVNVSARVGIALFPNGSADHDLLIRQADHAMFRAKLLGRNRFAFFLRDAVSSEDSGTGPTI